MNRLNEISFNSSLMREMRAIAFARSAIDIGARYDLASSISIKTICGYGAVRPDCVLEHAHCPNDLGCGSTADSGRQGHLLPRHGWASIP